METTRALLGQRCRYVACDEKKSMQQKSNFDEAWALAGTLILIPENSPAKKLNCFSRAKLRRALGLIDRTHSEANGFASDLWLCGKIEQRLGDFQQSPSSYLAANEIKPNDLDIVTGLITAALECGDSRTANEFVNTALTNWSNDELIQTLAAMAFLIAGNLKKAREIARLIEDEFMLSACAMVECGQRELPTNFFEIFPDVYGVTGKRIAT